MTLRTMPAGQVFTRPQNYHWEPPTDAFAQWAERPLAAEADDPNTISIYDVIGEDPWSGGGFTASRMAAALRSIGPKPVTAKINSPGGDMFEGIAIYNLLREHPAQVDVEVVGYAASAASVIAMAGDKIRMGLGTFMMVHNAWGLVIGNRHDMENAAQLFGQFDAALADIYEARTGLKRADVVALMDAETFLAPSEAVAKGFADEIADAPEKPAARAENAASRPIHARRRLEAALARAGCTRNARSELIAELLNTSSMAARDAGRSSAMRDAGDPAFAAEVQRMIATLKS